MTAAFFTHLFSLFSAAWACSRNKTGAFTTVRLDAVDIEGTQVSQRSEA
jgi:hypothetical protein